MIYACEISKEPGMQGVCGLLGKETVAGSDSEGFILALRGIVERFQVTWGVTPLHESDSGESVEIGFVLDLNGTHEPVADHVGRTCRHCANLMLALRIIGDWVFPRKESAHLANYRRTATSFVGANKANHKHARRGRFVL